MSKYAECLIQYTILEYFFNRSLVVLILAKQPNNKEKSWLEF